MDKTIRCTVCTWRGSWTIAESVRPPPPQPLSPALDQIQQAIEENQARNASFGGRHPPACPVCGHHTLETGAGSIRPPG